jgi:DNA-binding transcriptional MocR family regulator
MFSSVQHVPERQDQMLYEEIARQIRELIAHGTLRPGERIPSVRRLSRQRDVSISTVLQAYRVLESEGVIEAKPQSGYFVRPKLREVPAEPELSRPVPNATEVNVTELAMRVMDATRDPGLVRLGAALPSPELLPTAQLNRAMAAAGRRNPDAGNSYDVAPGNLALRVQISRRALESGCTLSVDDIVTTFGGTEALCLCLRAVAQPGDTIAIESPTYFGILQCIESLGMKALEIPTHPRDGVSLDALAFALETQPVKACLFVLNFNNPLGSCMPDENKRQLVEMLAARNIPLIEDDIYGDLAFTSNRPKTAKSFDRKGLVLLCDSFSKTLAPGYRVGWTAPGQFLERVKHLKIVSTMATATLPQMAIADFLANGGYDHHLRKVRRLYADKVALMTRAICEYFPEGTKVTRPQGGQVLWVELPERIKALELFSRALAEKISIAPGPIFSAKNRFQNFVRLNCGNPWSPAIEDALRRLGQLMK